VQGHGLRERPEARVLAVGVPVAVGEVRVDDAHAEQRREDAVPSALRVPGQLEREGVAALAQVVVAVDGPGAGVVVADAERLRDVLRDDRVAARR